MLLNEWAEQWGISLEAIADLRKRMGTIPTDPKASPTFDKSEAAIQTLVRLEASRKGLRLFRNNVGAGKMESGSFVRFGLANETPQMNANIKSADLIGVRPVLIQPHHVGTIIGQFVSREIKSGSWKYRGSDREVAQLRWAELITAMGGDACFANGEGTI